MTSTSSTNQCGLTGKTAERYERAIAQGYDHDESLARAMDPMPEAADTAGDKAPLRISHVIRIDEMVVIAYADPKHRASMPIAAVDEGHDPVVIEVHERFSNQLGPGTSFHLVDIHMGESAPYQILAVDVDGDPTDDEYELLLAQCMIAPDSDEGILFLSKEGALLLEEMQRGR